MSNDPKTDESGLPLTSGDPIQGSAWIEDAPDIEGDEVLVYAELTDVDEVAVIVRYDGGDVTVWMPRIQAIALAGQIAACATMSPTRLPHGHGPTGPCV
jgi:hypothetical protein